MSEHHTPDSVVTIPDVYKLSFFDCNDVPLLSIRELCLIFEAFERVEAALRCPALRTSPNGFNLEGSNKCANWKARASHIMAFEGDTHAPKCLVAWSALPPARLA
jgi:hypothetical protein